MVLKHRDDLNCEIEGGFQMSYIFSKEIEKILLKLPAPFLVAFLSSEAILYLKIEAFFFFGYIVLS